MDGIADMGGTDGWGRLHPPGVDEPVFAEPWQGRAFALSLAANRLTGGNLDSFRHALERLDRDAYLADGYYGRGLNGEETDEPPAPRFVKRSGASTADGVVRRIDAAPAYAVGQQVRAKNATGPDIHGLAAAAGGYRRAVRGPTGAADHPRSDGGRGQSQGPVTDPVDLGGPAGPPRSNGELLFAEPWESRAFGMAVALCERGLFTWHQFQAALIVRIDQWEAVSAARPQWNYYECWLAGLADLLASCGAVAAEDLPARAHALGNRPAGHDRPSSLGQVG